MMNTEETHMTAHSTNSLMTAIVQDRYGSADVLQLREIERPRPRADEVIVRVHAAGVDFGVWHLMAGLPYAVRLVSGLRRPRNPVRASSSPGWSRRWARR
jgi:NADPH:quinone reductase-like Zn-dependent oxidoreductase